MSIILELTSPVAIEQPTPVRIALAADRSPVGALALQPEAGGPTLPAQRDGDDAIVMILPSLEAGKTVRFKIERAASTASGVELKAGDGTLEIHLPQGLFSTYYYSPNAPRPYFWPVHGPGQKRVTRSYPMEQQEGEQKDHPHHRSLWTAFDEVNGTNNWAETEGHGWTRHQEFVRQEQGPVFGGFTARNLWTSADGQPIMTEARRVRVYNVGAEQRLLDYDVTWSAEHGPVTFGDTKEAGAIAVRVATSMDGARGGAIENAEGGRGEKQCWGKKSPWCDYSGPVDGETLGIAILDHPTSFNHAPRWHVRDYGLFATNPFSTAAFGGKAETPFTLQPSQPVTFHYRVLIHRGGAREGHVAEAYRIFAEPPQARVVTEDE
ncbi:MAG: PmoA family protein [Armatimonadota bacterium]|nr:PmoA family protein [Armatimonadota bacterium]